MSSRTHGSRTANSPNKTPPHADSLSRFARPRADGYGYRHGRGAGSTKSSIPEAQLKLINIQTGAENDGTTNREGEFLLPGVIPGAYTLRIERIGFATTQLTGLLLNEGDAKNLLIRMKVGSIAESVIVDASGLILNSRDASVSTAVDQKFVANVPLNGGELPGSYFPDAGDRNPEPPGSREWHQHTRRI